MYFCKIAGALILALSGVVGALTMNSAASKKATQSEALIAFLRFVRSRIECFSLPASEIIARCDKSLLSECGYNGDIPPRDMGDLFEAMGIRDDESYRILQAFAEGFGNSYREEQLKECDYYIDLLCERSQKIGEELPKKKKLNSTLCISSALGVAILLL